MCCVLVSFDSLVWRQTSVAAKPNHGFFHCQQVLIFFRQGRARLCRLTPGHHDKVIASHRTSRCTHYAKPLLRNTTKQGINFATPANFRAEPDAAKADSSAVKKPSPNLPLRKSCDDECQGFARLQDRFARKMRSLRKTFGVREPLIACVVIARSTTPFRIDPQRAIAQKKPARSLRNAPVRILHVLRRLSLPRPRAIHCTRPGATAR